MRKILTIMLIFILLSMIVPATAFERPARERDYIDIYPAEARQDITAAVREARQDISNNIAQVKEDISPVMTVTPKPTPKPVQIIPETVIVPALVDPVKITPAPVEIIIPVEPLVYDLTVPDDTLLEEIEKHTDTLEPRTVIITERNTDRVRKQIADKVQEVIKVAPAAGPETNNVNKGTTITAESQKKYNIQHARTEPNNLLAEYIQRYYPFQLYERYEQMNIQGVPAVYPEGTPLYPTFLRAINEGNIAGEYDAKADLGMIPERTEVEKNMPNPYSGIIYDLAYTRGYLEIMDLFSLEKI